MEEIAFIYLLGSAIIFLLGYYVFLKDPKKTLNKVFFIFSISGALWGGSTGFLFLFYPISTAHISVEEFIGLLERGPLWVLIDLIAMVGGYFLSSLFLHLSLIITEKKEILKRKIILFLIYLPPSLLGILGLISLFYVMLFKEVTFLERFVFPIEIFSIIFFETFLLIALIFLFKKYFSLKSSQERKKMSYFLIGVTIPAFFGSLFIFFFPLLFDIETYSWLTFPVYSLGYFFITIGVLRYGLFIDYREILETIFRRLNEMVVVTDKEGIIILTNEITLSKLSYKKEEFVGKKLEEFLKEGKEKWKEILKKIRKFGTVLEEKLSFLTKQEEEIPFLSSFSQTKEGIIFVGRDIKELVEYQERLEKEIKKRTEELEEAKSILEIKVAARTRELRELAKSLEEKVKERTKQLQEKIEELEKFQKLTIGRELKMVELKEEIERLKKENEELKKKMALSKD